MLVNDVCFIQGWYGNSSTNRFRFSREHVYNSKEPRYIGDQRSNFQPYWNIICKINEVKRV